MITAKKITFLVLFCLSYTICQASFDKYIAEIEDYYHMHCENVSDMKNFVEEDHSKYKGDFISIEKLTVLETNAVLCLSYISGTNYYNVTVHEQGKVFLIASGYKWHLKFHSNDTLYVQRFFKLRKNRIAIIDFLVSSTDSRLHLGKDNREYLVFGTIATGKFVVYGFSEFGVFIKKGEWRSTSRLSYGEHIALVGIEPKFSKIFEVWGDNVP